MLIDQIDVFLVRFPLKQEVRLADIPQKEFETVFIRMQSGNYSGWGEVTPGNFPSLTSSWTQGVYSLLKRFLIPKIMESRSIESGEKLAEMLSVFKGNRHAKAALDLAWNDLASKQKKIPLYQFLGGKKRNLEIGLTFDRYDNLDRFLMDIQKAVDEKYKRVTLKLRPGWDVQILGAVRSEFPSLMIQCDLEGALDIERHSDLLYRMEDFMPVLLEQPLDPMEFVGHAQLQDVLRTPIALDESIKTVFQADIALDLQSAGFFCMKPGRVGGLTEGKAIHNLALAQEVYCYGGFDFQTSIGYRHLLSLASLPGFTLPCDSIRFEEILECDPGKKLLSFIPEPDQEVQNASDSNQKDSDKSSKISESDSADKKEAATKQYRSIALWDEPGIGVEPEISAFEPFIVERFSSKSTSAN